MKKKIIVSSIIVIVVLLIIYYVYSNLVHSNSLKGYEKVEFILTIIGMFATFFGALIGALVAGNNSRKLFKQEIKMNDLQQHMDANIFILEEMNIIKDKIRRIESDLNKSFPFYPHILEDIKKNYEEISHKLEELRINHLKNASIIIYHDILQFKTIIDKHSKSFEYPISKIETEKLIEETLNLKVSETNWIEWSTNYIKEDKLIYEHLRKLEDTHGNYIEIPISDIVAKNREFFDERLKELKKGIYNINNVYNFMNYRNTHDLKNEYIGLYED
ncbi:hypothetical protein NGH46_06495 [Staphylococcus xylosus]|uniref:hypothetical protein n=1 Tax=Staphylococcus xylosus TaxID=1288 RepID=UPI002DB9EEBE|nr:hypothetical protein [Staphylococcus xylosus]MEB8121765.1 hypothetical protein [Staphylococcus xylosus]